MLPILPSTGMQVEACHEHYAPDNEEAFAQRQGRLVRPSGLRGFRHPAWAAVDHDGGDHLAYSDRSDSEINLTGKKSLGSPNAAINPTA